MLEFDAVHAVVSEAAAQTTRHSHARLEHRGIAKQSVAFVGGREHVRTSPLQTSTGMTSIPLRSVSVLGTHKMRAQVSRTEAPPRLSTDLRGSMSGDVSTSAYRPCALLAKPPYTDGATCGTARKTNGIQKGTRQLTPLSSNVMSRQARLRPMYAPYLTLDHSG